MKTAVVVQGVYTNLARVQHLQIIGISIGGHAKTRLLGAMKPENERNLEKFDQTPCRIIGQNAALFGQVSCTAETLQWACVRGRRDALRQ